MKSAIALLIQLAILAAVGFGVRYVLRVGEKRASNTAPAAPPGAEDVRPAASGDTPADPARKSEPEAVAKEEHAPPDFS